MATLAAKSQRGTPLSWVKVELKLSEASIALNARRRPFSSPLASTLRDTHPHATLLTGTGWDGKAWGMISPRMPLRPIPPLHPLPCFPKLSPSSCRLFVC